MECIAHNFCNAMVSANINKYIDQFSNKLDNSRPVIMKRIVELQLKFQMDLEFLHKCASITK